MANMMKILKGPVEDRYKIVLEDLGGFYVLLEKRRGRKKNLIFSRNIFEKEAQDSMQNFPLFPMRLFSAR